MRRLILAAAPVLVAGAAAHGGIPEIDQAGEPLQCAIAGRYEGWGFALDVPKGLKGCDGWPRAILIPLGRREENRYVIADGLDSAALVENEAVGLIASFLDAADLPGAKLEAHDRTWLGLARAERLTFSYFDPVKGDPMRIVFVTALSGPVVDETGAPAYAVSLSLTTTLATYREDLAVFERIRRSWVELDDEECCCSVNAVDPAIVASR